MKKPQFRHSDALYTATWLLAIPILVEICTACTLYSMWIAWVLLFFVAVLVIWRMVFALKQKCWAFAGSLFGQLALAVAILIFFQLSFNNVIQTPLSHPVSTDVVEVSNPIQQHPDSAYATGSSCPLDQ